MVRLCGSRPFAVRGDSSDFRSIETLCFALAFHDEYVVNDKNTACALFLFLYAILFLFLDSFLFPFFVLFQILLLFFFVSRPSIADSIVGAFQGTDKSLRNDTMGTKDLEKASTGGKGTRVTPRTCLWPLTLTLLATFGLSIGLTFRSNHHCYAATCGEWLFPLQARLHVIVWYMWLSLSTAFLAIRAFHPQLQRVLSRHVIERKLPPLQKGLSRGGLLMIFWVFCLYGTVIGIWWPRLHEYFDERNTSAGIRRGGKQLAAIALTGHMCDITMGMVLLPISRHSALVSFFQIDVSSALTNHILAAYTLFTLVMIHGLIYLSWIPVFNSLSIDLRKIIPVLNPTYLYRETWPGNASSLGIWRASLIFSGCLAALIMLVLFVTALPKVRTTHFNLFYFTHLSSIVMVVIICLHASTMFYCTIPGLAMWVLDWSMRLYELRKPVCGNIADLGRGWYW